MSPTSFQLLYSAISHCISRLLRYNIIFSRFCQGLFSISLPQFFAPCWHFSHFFLFFHVSLPLRKISLDFYYVFIKNLLQKLLHCAIILYVVCPMMAVLHIGMSPSGKAPDFDSGIRRFKSGHPSQFMIR